MVNFKSLAERPNRMYFIVFGCFLALYIFTSAPGLLWQDSGEFHYRAWQNDLEGIGELVRSHPLYIAVCLLVKLIPGGNFAGKVNAVSSLFGAITIANIFYLVRLWTSSNKAGLVSALSLGLSWTFWQHAAIAEVYTLYAAMLSAELIMLFLYLKSSRHIYLYSLFFLNGLSISNHLFGIFPLLCYTFLILLNWYKKEINLRLIVLLAVAWAIGNSLYLYFILKIALAKGSLLFAIKSATVGHFQNQITNFSLSVRVVLENIGFILYNFCSPALILLFLGIIWGRRVEAPKYFWPICLWIMGIFFVFAFRYNVPDRYAFFIPFYLMAAVFIGLGAHTLLKHQSFSGIVNQVWIFSLIIGCPLFFYWQTPVQLERYQFSLGTKRKIPFRNEYEYFLSPWQHTTTQAEKYARESLLATSPNSVILVDAMIYHPLWLYQKEHSLRLDVKIIMDSGPEAKVDDIKRFADEGKLYVVSPIQDYCPNYLLDNYSFVKVGPVFHVTSKQK